MVGWLPTSQQLVKCGSSMCTCCHTEFVGWLVGYQRPSNWPSVALQCVPAAIRSLLVGWLVTNVPATGQVWLFNVYLLPYGVCWLVGWLPTSQQLAKCGSSMCTCCHTEFVGWLVGYQRPSNWPSVALQCVPAAIRSLLVGWMVTNVPATGQVWLFNVYLLPYGVCWLVGWLPTSQQLAKCGSSMCTCCHTEFVGWLVANVPATGQVWLFNVYLLPYGVCWLVGWLLTFQQLAKCGSSMCTCCHTEFVGWLVGWLLTSQQLAKCGSSTCTCCHTEFVGWLVGWLVANVPATGQVWLFNVYLLPYGVCWLVGWLLTSQQLAKCGSSTCTCCHTEFVGWLVGC